MEFLLEIMTEELPSSHAKSAWPSSRKISSRDRRLPGWKFSNLRAIGTCRRLVLIADLGERQPDQEEIVTGPPRTAGLAPDGSFTQAALGFARSQGVEVDNLQVIKTARGEYLGFKRLKKGSLHPRFWKRNYPL